MQGYNDIETFLLRSSALQRNSDGSDAARANRFGYDIEGVLIGDFAFFEGNSRLLYRRGNLQLAVFCAIGFDLQGQLIGFIPFNGDVRFGSRIDTVGTS